MGKSWAGLDRFAHVPNCDFFVIIHILPLEPMFFQNDNRILLGFVYRNIETIHFVDPSKGTGLGRAVFRLMRPQVNKHRPCGSCPVEDFFTAQRDSLLHKGIPHYTKGFLTTYKEFFTTQTDSLLHKGVPVRGARFPRNTGY